MGISDQLLTWKGPSGLSGQIKGGRQLGPDDWTCPSCNLVVFCSKKKGNDRALKTCFKCGANKPEGNNSGGADDRRRGGGRRSPSYNRRGGDRGRRRSPSGSDVS